VEEVSAWAEEHVGVAPDRERRAVFGFSNGAAFAVAMGLRHPERFGHVPAFSLAWRFDSPNWPAHLAPRHYLVAGMLEEGFREGTARWANTLAGLGVTHIHRERMCGHDFMMWDKEFPGAVAWAFG
jgi:enterochelin esterase-like enzyme